MTVRLMAWKQGWICGRGWMWFQCSIEHFIRHFTWRCGSFSLLLGLPSSGSMLFGVVLLSWYGLVFGKNWEFIDFLQTQLYGLVEVLDSYGEYSCWIACYGPIWLQGISQEAGQSSLKYEVRDIFDEFLMSTMWDIWRFVITSRR